jgi:hypothetical protein
MKPHVWVRDPTPPWGLGGGKWFYCAGCDDHCWIPGWRVGSLIHDHDHPTLQDMQNGEIDEDCDEHAVWNVMED